MAVKAMLESRGGGKPPAEARVRKVWGYAQAVVCTAVRASFDTEQGSFPNLSSFFIKWK